MFGQRTWMRAARRRNQCKFADPDLTSAAQEQPSGIAMDSRSIAAVVLLLAPAAASICAAPPAATAAAPNAAAPARITRPLLFFREE